jgi:hypothetical protein
MDGRGKVYLSVFLEDDNMKVTGAVRGEEPHFLRLYNQWNSVVSFTNQVL